MSTRIDPEFMTELKKYGAVGVEKCFNCGNCTAICPLSSDEHPFPRNVIRRIQVGQRGRLVEQVDPWLCYYCGECSETCPKGAEPAETMMAARRWLTAQYDRSGHGAKLYTSTKATWFAIMRFALVPLLLLVIFHALNVFGLISSGSIVTDRVELNKFAPVYWVWAVVLIDFALLGYRVVSNAAHMHQLILGADGQSEKIPPHIYLQELKTLLTHAFTQKRWLDCGEDHSRWFKHILLVSGYIIMLALIVGLLWWFQTDEIYPLYHPQRWLGYYATIVLLYVSGDAMIERIRKREQLHRFSHHSDWFFPGFLFLGALTGILVHIFRYVGWPWPTYIIYTIHVMAMIAMLDSEVGIGKWAHFIYRPLAMYFEAIKETARREISTGALAPVD